MSRVLVGLAFVVLALWVFAIIDLILIEERRIRGLNKVLWLFVILLLPAIGAILWFTIGRGSASEEARRTIGPDDDPTFLRNLRRDEELDKRIRRLEQELADLDDDPPKD
ncbi:MAG: hypothetical protein EPN91_08005 [Salinibacterium sp.]|nr:MAG: hypothetical protein EPN91_08005 [Salinibacterium sp.]